MDSFVPTPLDRLTAVLVAAEDIDDDQPPRAHWFEDANMTMGDLRLLHTVLTNPATPQVNWAGLVRQKEAPRG